MATRKPAGGEGEAAVARGENESDSTAMGRSSRSGLELGAVLRVLSAFAMSDVGRDGVVELSPIGDRRERDLELGRQAELAELLSDEGVILPRQETPWKPALERLQGSGTGMGLGTKHILALASLLEAFDRCQRRLGSKSTPTLYASMVAAFQRRKESGDTEADSRVEEVEIAADLARKVRSVLDGKGEVRRDATPKLAALNASVRSTRDSLYQQFERYAKEHGDVLGDDTVTRSEGRLAVLLPAGHRGRLQGIVHGRSGTEKSYYFEPLELVEENNRLREHQEQEEAERERILVELAGLFNDHRKLIGQVAAFMTTLDVCQAAVRFGVDVEAHHPNLSRPEATEETRQFPRWSVHGARHPLLDERLQGLRASELGSPGHRGTVVPLDIEANEDRVLVITGPNAGGKTVALKTLGVVSYLAACGWPIPTVAEPRSSLPLFHRWMAVVGDEQDVMADRSTFSARLERLRSVWEDADQGTLVLLDEIGSGTNPEEGAALSIALLERLVERGCFAVITTHLLQVANAALAQPGCASLAMELDAESGAPTFRIRAGAPGSSHALDLARRLGLAEEWISRAEELLGEEQLTLRHLIAESERSKQEAAEIERDLRQLRDNERTLQKRQEEELATAREERKSARKKVSGELEQFRRSARDELAREVRRLRAMARERAASNVAGSGESSGQSDRTAVKKAARVAERLTSDSPLAKTLEEIGAAEPAEIPVDGLPEVGDEVRHRGLGWTGKVESVKGDGRKAKAEVLVRGKRVRCHLAELVIEQSSQKRGGRGLRRIPKAKKSMVTTNADQSAMSTELMLVGERVEPALAKLDGYLDHALLANLEQGRVVHGLGTGRLRKAVHERLRKHPSVSSFELAPAEQGGAGATLVMFKE